MRHQRSALLDEYYRVTRDHREAAIRRLRSAARRRADPRRGRYVIGASTCPSMERAGRRSAFGQAAPPGIRPALVLPSSGIMGVRVAPMAREVLLAASPATLDLPAHGGRLRWRGRGAVAERLADQKVVTTIMSKCRTLMSRILQRATTSRREAVAYRRPARLAGPLGFDVCLQPAPPREGHVGASS